MKSPVSLYGLMAAALPVMLAGCGPRGYSPGDLGRDSARGAISLEAAKDEGAFWDVEPGIRLYHFSRGSGSPVLILHGGPGMPSNDPWPGLAPLERKHTFFYYHQRGCGKSTRPVQRFTSSNFPRNAGSLVQALGLESQLADIERIRKWLGVRRLTLAGHSFGGFLAALYAAELPQRVEKLVLAAPADLLRFPPPDGGLYERVKRLLPGESAPAYQAWLARFFDFGSIFKNSEEDLQALNAGFFPYWSLAENAMNATRCSGGRSDPALVGGWVQQAVFFSMGQKYDYREALTKVRAPVLVLSGDKDPAGGPSVNDYRAFPNVRWETLKGAGHFLQQDVVDFPRIVGDFLGD
jgi:proline iminopeptidase